jgi:hypothetical protein
MACHVTKLKRRCSTSGLRERIFFTDRDLGTRFPEILAAAGLLVQRHRDHFPPDCPDEEWLRAVGENGWVAITHDSRIRYKPNELAAVIRHHVSLLVVIGKAPFPVLANNLLKITTTFRLNQDPGASFALADSLDAAIAMADILGFGSLAVVAKARPVIQAVTAALHEIPEPARLKLANAQFGTHRCSGSPGEFPLLCSFATEISDQAIVVSPYPAGTITQQDAPSRQAYLGATVRRPHSRLPHYWLTGDHVLLDR